MKIRQLPFLMTFAILSLELRNNGKATLVSTNFLANYSEEENMTKYIPTITEGKSYNLSLVAVNIHDKTCDLIWSYIDDDGDQMFVREFSDDFIERVEEDAVVPRGRVTREQTKNCYVDFKAHGAYRNYSYLAGLVISTGLTLMKNKKTMRTYTKLTGPQTVLPTSQFKMSDTCPNFWLTGKSYFGPTRISVLDVEYHAAKGNAMAELRDIVDYYESGNFDDEMCWKAGLD